MLWLRLQIQKSLKISLTHSLDKIVVMKLYKGAHQLVMYVGFELPAGN